MRPAQVEVLEPLSRWAPGVGDAGLIEVEVGQVLQIFHGPGRRPTPWSSPDGGASARSTPPDGAIPGRDVGSSQMEPDQVFHLLRSPTPRRAGGGRTRRPGSECQRHWQEHVGGAGVVTASRSGQNKTPGRQHGGPEFNGECSSSFQKPNFAEAALHYTPILGAFSSSFFSSVSSSSGSSDSFQPTSILQSGSACCSFATPASVTLVCHK